MTEFRIKAWLWIFAIIAGMQISSPVRAQQLVDFSPAIIDQWANDTFGKAYDQRRFSGLGIIAVQDGRVIYTKSFGYADYALEKPIDPAITRFRIGSATKTFTALAIAKLVEEGRIRSLDDPANRYLKRLQLPRVGPREVTIWDLLNHSADFEEPDWSYDLTARPMTAADISKHVPRQNQSAGKTANYCNFCVAVLGLMVEDVTGDLLQDYLDRVVFRPLGMRDTVLNMSRWPSPNLGKAYVRSAGQVPVLQPFAAIPEFYAPAGSIEATLDDMARYMVAALGGDGSQIVSKQSWATQLSRHYGNHRASSGFGMLWMAHRWNGVDVREHGGAIGSYHSIMALFPASNAGIFISCFCPQLGVSPKPGALFGLTGHNFREMIYTKFLGMPPMRALPLGDLEPYVGTYKTETRDSRWPAPLGFLLAPRTTTVEKTNDGLMINGMGPYLRTGDDVFRFPGVNGGDPFIPFTNRETAIFIRDSDGAIERMTGLLSHHTERRIGFLQLPPVQRGIWIGATVLLALGLGSFALARNSALDRRAHHLLWVTAVLGIFSSTLIVASFMLGRFGEEMWANERRSLAIALAVPPVLTGFATMGCLGFAVLLWRAGGASRRRALQSLLVALGGMALSGLFLASS